MRKLVLFLSVAFAVSYARSTFACDQVSFTGTSDYWNAQKSGSICSDAINAAYNGATFNCYKAGWKYCIQKTAIITSQNWSTDGNYHCKAQAIVQGSQVSE